MFFLIKAIGAPSPFFALRPDGRPSAKPICDQQFLGETQSPKY
ncbi:hypothetical protein [Cardinium endosymbiont of Dermatophagoides farinae]|nr:hypothetical protein [Cardinium endosymbiont of Dermatophagoides farinae]